MNKGVTKIEYGMAHVIFRLSSPDITKEQIQGYIETMNATLQSGYELSGPHTCSVFKDNDGQVYGFITQALIRKGT